MCRSILREKVKGRENEVLGVDECQPSLPGGNLKSSRSDRHFQPFGKFPAAETCQTGETKRTERKKKSQNVTLDKEKVGRLAV